MSAWAANTVYQTTAVVVPTTFVDSTWIATAGGTSGNVEPVWPAFGSGTNTIADGTVAWKRGTGFRQSLQAGIKAVVATFAAANPTIVGSVYTVRPGSFAAASLPCFYIGDMSEQVDTSQGTRTRTFSGFSAYLVDEYGTIEDSNDRMNLAADALVDLFTENYHAAGGASLVQLAAINDTEFEQGNVRFPALEFVFATTKTAEGRV